MRLLDMMDRINKIRNRRNPVDPVIPSKRFQRLSFAVLAGLCMGSAAAQEGSHYQPGVFNTQDFAARVYDARPKGQGGSRMGPAWGSSSSQGKDP